MTTFADASAVVKLFADEASSERVRGASGPYVVSALSQVEVASALWRKHRDGELSAHDAHVIVDGLRWDLADGRFSSGAAVAEVSIGADVLDAAARLVAVELMRTGDAIQLASALAVRSADPECTNFLVFDRRLAEAATTEGFDVQPVPVE